MIDDKLQVFETNFFPDYIDIFDQWCSLHVSQISSETET